MVTFALPLLAAAAALPATRSFWTLVPGAWAQPAQVEVPATLAREGKTVAVYQEDGYRFSAAGPDDEQSQIAAAVETFDKVIFPREVGLFGPCPDRDGNGKVIVLISRAAPTEGSVVPFDEMSEAEAMRYGFHSNQGEVLFAPFELQGNRAAGNVRAVARAFHLLLHETHDPGETAWSRLLANYTPYLCGLASPRLLWGDTDPEGRAHSPADPWTAHGWSLLFLEYLRDRLGDEGLRRLVELPDHGLAGIDHLLRERGGSRTAADLAGDFAMACWLDDPVLAGGRFSFSTVVPPRPAAAARAVASRPTSGGLEVGVGGMAFLLVDGDGERPFPLTLQGDPSVRWVGRAVRLRAHGPDQELPLAFAPSGLATLELPLLASGESVVVAVVAVPADSPLFDRRALVLRWGIGWVPHAPADPGREAVAKALKREFPDGGVAACTRLMSTVDLLSGAATPPSSPVIKTRYAWAPDAANVVAMLRQEAAQRGLSVRVETFTQRSGNGAEQQWSNVVIELPGSDPRRWPVVLAAHWDAARNDLADSYLRALDLDDNASGVAVALAAASAIGRMQHRAPILVAFLAGGFQGAAGARALLERLEGHVSAWIELDRVGTTGQWPRTLEVTIEGGRSLPRFPWSLQQSFRRARLVPHEVDAITDAQAGVAAAAARGIAAALVTTCPEPGPDELDTPPGVERQRLSPGLMALLTKVLGGAAVNLAGPQ